MTEQSKIRSFADRMLTAATLLLAGVWIGMGLCVVVLGSEPLDAMLRVKPGEKAIIECDGDTRVCRVMSEP